MIFNYVEYEFQIYSYIIINYTLLQYWFLFCIQVLQNKLNHCKRYSAPLGPWPKIFVKHKFHENFVKYGYNL